jgi:hypothetical protein
MYLYLAATSLANTRQAERFYRVCPPHLLSKAGFHVARWLTQAARRLIQMEVTIEAQINRTELGSSY